MAKVKTNTQNKPVSLLHWQAECPPDWASDPRAITVLRTKNIPATKEYIWMDDGTYRKVPPRKLPDGKALHAQQYHVRVALPKDIRELAAVLEEAAKDACNLVVRGYVVDRPKTRKQTVARDQKTIHDTPRHWFMNDLDGFPMPTDFDWRDDLARTAKWAVETYLPAFAGSAFIHQFSASAGVKPGLRLHLWFWLDTPVDSTTLNRYFKKTATDLLRYKDADAGIEASFDIGVLNSIQEHFIANPIISRKDPLNGHPRLGFIDGSMTLVLPITSVAPADSASDLSGDLQSPEEEKALAGWQPTLDDVAGMAAHVITVYGKLVEEHQSNGGEWWASPWRRCITALKHHLIVVLKMAEDEAHNWIDENFSKLLPSYDAAENRRMWENIRVDLAPERQVKIGTFIKYAQQDGWKPSKAARDAQKEAAERKAKAAIDEIQRVGWLYCVASNEFYCENPFQKLTKEQFANKFAYLKEGRTSFADQCLEDGSFRRVDAYTFDPRTDKRFIKEDGLQKLNLYRPNILIAQPGDVKRFLDHAAYILPDEKQRHILFQVMAFHIQRPGEKIKWALILYGRAQRTGKSYFGYVQRKILGQHNVRTVANEQLHEPWTVWQEGTQLVIVEELKGSGSRYEVLNKLKPMIVEPITSVRYPGGRVGYDMPNRYNFLMFTNHQDALPLELSDQRYCVLSSPAVRKPSAYYAGHQPADAPWADGLWDWTDKNLAAIKHFLGTYSLSGLDHNGEAPRTQGFLDMVERSESDLVEWIKEQIANEMGLFGLDIVIARHVLMVLPPSLKVGVGKNKIAAALENAGAMRCTYRAQLGKLGYPNVYSIRNHDTWKEADEGALGKYYVAMIEHAIGAGRLKDASDMDSKIVQKFEADGRVFEGAIRETGKGAM